MLPAARGALQLGADLVLVCPELVETKNYSQVKQDYSFHEPVKLSGRWQGSLCWNVGVLWSWVLLDRKSVV